MGKLTSLEMTVTITAKIRVYCTMNSLVCEGYSLWQVFLPISNGSSWKKTNAVATFLTKVLF